MRDRGAQSVPDDGGRDPQPGWFASGGELDGAPPSARVLGALETLALPCGPGASSVPGPGGGPGRSGPDPGPGSGPGPGSSPGSGPCGCGGDDGDDGCGGVPLAGATHDEAAGMLAAAAGVESRAAAVKLAVVREIIRRHAPAAPGGAMPDPGTWDIGVLHEVAAILRISPQSAGPVVELAWQLEARLPGTGRLLATGVASPLVARIIAEEFSVLDADKAAEAEKLLLDRDLAADDMTPGRIRRLCQRISDAVDPDGAARRREQQERDAARVRFYRAHGGSGTLFASGLPADEALRSEANVQKRALEYKGAGIREKMDFLRVLALCDLVNGLPVHGRLARWRAEQAEKQRTGADDPGRRAWAEEQADEQAADAARRRHGDGAPFPDAEPGDLDDRDPGGPRESDDQGAWDDGGPDDETGGGGPDDGETGGGGPRDDGPDRMTDPGLPALVNLTFPLATVLGQADRPGEAPGYGSLDPALARRLAAAASESPRSEFCVTFTDSRGHAAAHGCARLIRPTGNGPPGTGWDLTRDTTRPGPDGGYGAWVLTLPADGQPGEAAGGRPGGRRYRVDMHKIPLHDCDHTYATDAYRPGALLRHLVQVRDGECTFPGCTRPARHCDFEHAVPYHQGGATDACNAGMRSRSCHKVKQSPGWSLTQPEPGWHTWTTPSGRSYTSEPKDYPS